MFYNLFRKLLLLNLAIVAVPTISAENTLSYKTNIEKIARAYHDVYNFSGTIKVVKSGEEITESSFGLANREFEIKNQPHFRFSINSISKTFTATAVMQLVERKQLELEAPISRYLPELNAQWKDRVTLGHLLTHSSGLPRESGVSWYQDLSLKDQVTELVNNQKLMFTPGERYEYSNSGVILLGRILENVTGLAFEKVIIQNVLEPIKLNNTGVYNGNEVVKMQAVPYRMSPNGISTALRAKHLGQNSGGGLYSTVNDLFRFVTALKNNELLTHETTSLMFTPHIKSDDGDQHGYGWTLKSFGDQVLWFAAGSGYGTKSVVMYSPTQNDFVGITSNWGNTPIMQLMASIFMAINDLEYNIPDSSVLAKPSLYSANLGTYYFKPGLLGKHLMMDNDTITLQIVDDKLFLNEELLAQKPNGKLGLTYTEELSIEFKNDELIININNNQMIGKKNP